MKKIFLVTAAIITLIGGVEAQRERRVSEADVQMEKLFVDAGKEKLIGNDSSAVEIYLKILDTDEENAAAAFELARIYKKFEDYEAAEKMAQLAVREEPSNSWYKILLSEIYDQLGKFEAAADLYADLRDQFPKKEDYYNKQAFYLVKSNDLKGAVKVYEDLEKEIGLTENIIRQKHNFYLGSGDVKKAAKELERLSEAYPRNLDYLHELAEFYKRVDQTEDARTVYQRILEIDPDNPKANMALASGDKRSSNDEEYLSALKPVFENPGASIDLKIGKIIPLLEKVSESGDPQLADAVLELTTMLEQTHPENAKGYAASGDLLFHSGRLTEAAGKYKEALQREESVYTVWEQLLYILNEQGHSKELIRTAEQAMDVFPNKISNNYYAGLGYLGLKDGEEALYYLEEALLMSGRMPEMQQQIIGAVGMAYIYQNDLTEAKDAMDKAIEINDKDPFSQIRMAYYEASSGQAEAAARRLQAVGKRNQNLAEWIATAAFVKFHQGDYEQAVSQMEGLLERQSMLTPANLELYGDLLFKSGNTAKALEYWNKALDGGNKSNDLPKKIADKKL